MEKECRKEKPFDMLFVQFLYIRLLFFRGDLRVDSAGLNAVNVINASQALNAMGNQVI